MKLKSRKVEMNAIDVGPCRSGVFWDLASWRRYFWLSGWLSSRKLSILISSSPIVQYLLGLSKDGILCDGGYRMFGDIPPVSSCGRKQPV